MYIAAEALFVFSIIHEPDSVFALLKTELRIVALVFLLLTLMQNVIARRSIGFRSRTVRCEGNCSIAA